MFEQIAATCGLPLDLVEQLIVFDGWGLRFERGEVSPMDFFTLLRSHSKTDFSFEALLKASSDIFHPNEPLVKIAEELKAKGVRLYALSNTNETHFHYLYTHFPCLHLFDGYVLSFEVGALKPEPEIFNAALQMAESSKNSCFYVDDIPDYVYAARENGIDAEIFTTAENCREHLGQRGFL